MHVALVSAIERCNPVAIVPVVRLLEANRTLNCILVHWISVRSLDRAVDIPEAFVKSNLPDNGV